MADLNARLTLAAVELSTILTNNGTKHGIFGGWALKALGGDRETKDVDCIAAIGKNDLIEVMAQHPAWIRIPNMREDYAPFFWDDDLKKPVLVEIFPGSIVSPANTENATLAMRGVRTQTVQVNGSSVQLLDNFYVFKGKLHAAAYRYKELDAADLLYLCRFHAQAIREHADTISLEQVGKAVKRYPKLAEAFSEIGINVQQAVEQQGSSELGGRLQLGPPPFDVQKGIIG